MIQSGASREVSDLAQALGKLLELRQKAFQSWMDAIGPEETELRFGAWTMLRHAIEHLQRSPAVVAAVHVKPKEQPDQPPKKSAAMAHKIMDSILSEARQEKQKRRFA